MSQQIYFSKPHKIIFLWPVIFYWIGLYMIMHQLTWKNPGFIFIGVGVVLTGLVILAYRHAFFSLSTDKIYIGGGLFKPRIREIPLDIIEDIDIQQTMTGFFLRYGTLRLIGDNGKKAEFHNIRKPRLAKHEIERMIAEIR